jgi:hypothetical protein
MGTKVFLPPGRMIKVFTIILWFNHTICLDHRLDNVVHIRNDSYLRFPFQLIKINTSPAAGYLHSFIRQSLE